MELNEITKRLPPHLMQFVVDQPYQLYTPVDQAVWRYVMRKNYFHLVKVAHESYIDGLKMAGIEIENIPTMYGMNRILQKIGWAAVAVDGFIPPGAFMEFTAYKVLVIAADIRTLEHIEYTPAPDIIHESAGHAPIIAHPDFAEYLIEIGKVGSRAFSSKKDYELYEAIRHLSIIKEDPYTSLADIEEGEQRIAEISANMGKPSEMALLRNLHWWTVEYGLVGTLDNYKIYGAGLLSSIGEGESCLKPEVKKIRYSIEAAYVNYDITKTQPQLFVTPDFAHLQTVLQQFAQNMAFKTGGREGLEKAVASENTGTAVFDTGLQVSGTFTDYKTDENGNLIFIKTSGPTALAFQDKQIVGHGKKTHKNGFLSPVGKIESVFISSEKVEDFEIFLEKSLGKEVLVKTESKMQIKGNLEDLVSKEGKVLLIKLKEAEMRYEETLLFSKDMGDLWIALGKEISSVFSGPADIEAFKPTAEVSKEKTHKISYDAKTLKLHKLYDLVRNIRKTNRDEYLLPKIASIGRAYFPDDWLLQLEILELLEKRWPLPRITEEITEHLIKLKSRKVELTKLIDDGLALI
jgi:phenylalanine-4-hydroxylase